MTGEGKEILHRPMDINTKNTGNTQKWVTSINNIVITSKMIVINFFSTKQCRRCGPRLKKTG